MSVPIPIVIGIVRTMAVVAQLVEHLIVVQEVAGSSPVGRPFLYLQPASRVFSFQLDIFLLD